MERSVMPYLSFDVLAPQKTINLSPFATFRDPGRAGYFPKSAIRALQIMELLANANRPLRAIEISTPLGISPSSASQLLKAMMDWAYLLFDPVTKRYYPSPLVAKFAAPITTDYFGPGALDRLMDAALETFDALVSILASQGTFMQVMDNRFPQQSERIVAHAARKSEDDIGTQIPLFGSCTGAAWLSCQSEATVRTAIRLCRRYLGSQANDAEFIMERLRRIREQGYAYGGISSDDGCRTLALPLPPTSNGIVLVMSLFGETEMMDEHREEMAAQAKELIRQHLKSTKNHRYHNS
jgi:DNA-binding IclR family transcriptional regulator